MNLIELYIQEVIRRIPENSRGDIALELRSTIEDMLPDDYTEEDIKAVLSKLGNPAILANGYQDRPMYLIGPRYYEMYINLLKMILPIAITISLISLVADNLGAYTGDEALRNVIQNIVGEGISTFLSTAVQVFFWLTLVFFILERSDHAQTPVPIKAGSKEWKPEDLKKVSHIPKEKAISKVEVFLGLIWTATWATVYFNAANLIGIYEQGEFVTSVFNQDVLHSYWPLVVMVIGLEFALGIYKWITAEWTNKVATLNTVVNFVTSVVFIIMISNRNLVNDSTITYFNELFSVTNVAQNSTYGIAVFIFVLIAAIDSYKGFRKAKIAKGLA
ncbi:MAG: hypothetical protein K6T94_04520 [Paenibacillus sp.]|nr:hypothetical protein [Paenibacillus sp.]